MEQDVIQTTLEICARSRINPIVLDDANISNLGSRVVSSADSDEQKKDDLEVLTNHFDMSFLQQLKENKHFIY